MQCAGTSASLRYNRTLSATTRPQPTNAPEGGGSRAYRRSRCGLCGLPSEACICDQYRALPATALRITLIVAADESTRPSNTARLLALWFDGAELRVRGLRGIPLEQSGFSEPGTAVLFPGPDATALTWPSFAELTATGSDVSAAPRCDVSAAPRCDVSEGAPSAVRHLLVPDGTWRQARRILRHELLPLGLPCVTLPEGLPSLYGLRRHAEGNLCTIEASCAALACLGAPRTAASLLNRFAHWMAVADAHHRGHDRVPLAPERARHPMAQLLAGAE